MNRKDNIPSDEDLERASRIMRERAKGLDQVAQVVMSRF